MMLCLKHTSMRMNKVCLDLGCEEVITCEKCLEETYEHQSTQSINDFVEKGECVDRYQKMKKQLLGLNEKLSLEKQKVNDMISQSFSSLKEQLSEILEKAEASVQTLAWDKCESFRRIFSKLLQEIQEGTHSAKKAISLWNDFENNNNNKYRNEINPNSPILFEEVQVVQRLKSLVKLTTQKVPHLEMICNELESQEMASRANTIKGKELFEEMSKQLVKSSEILNEKLKRECIFIVDLSVETEPPRVNTKSVFNETIKQFKLEQTIYAHSSPISQIIAISSDNQLNGENGHFISTSWDGTIKKWNIFQKQPIINVKTYNGGITCSDFITKNGKQLAICSYFDSSLEIVDISNDYDEESSRIISRFEPREKVINQMIIKNKQKLICGCSSSSIITIDIFQNKTNNSHSQLLTSNQIAHIPNSYSSSVSCLSDFSSPSESLFLSSSEKYINLWDLRSNLTVQQLPSPSETVSSISQITEYIFGVGAHDSVIKLWDIRMFRPIKSYFAHRDAVTKVIGLYSKLQQQNQSFLQNMFVSSGNDNNLKVWNILDQQPQRFQLVGHSDVIWSLDIDPFNRRIYSGARNEEIKVWQYNT